MVKVNREKTQIIRDILEACEIDVRISHVSRKARLTTDKVHEIMDFLIKRDLVNVTEKQRRKISWPKHKSNTYNIYKITPEGLQLKKCLDIVVEFLND